MKMIRPQFAHFIAGRHSRAKSGPTHDIDVEKAHPVSVGNIFERLWLEDAEVVDQDLDTGMLADQRRRTGFAEVAGEPPYIIPRRGPDLRRGRADGA
jgi:hypothetical protein